MNRVYKLAIKNWILRKRNLNFGILHCLIVYDFSLSAVSFPSVSVSLCSIITSSSGIYSSAVGLLSHRESKIERNGGNPNLLTWVSFLFLGFPPLLSSQVLSSSSSCFRFFLVLIWWHHFSSLLLVSTQVSSFVSCCRDFAFSCFLVQIIWSYA